MPLLGGGLHSVGRAERTQRAGAPAADSGCIMRNCVSRDRAGKPRVCGVAGEGSGVDMGPGARALRERAGH